MYESLMKHISEQQIGASGAVDRPEFDRDYGGDQVSFDVPGQREKVKAFVLRNTPHRHRYKDAEGRQGVVYFDARGRAASCVLEQIPDDDLVRIAHEFSKRFPGEPNHDKPQTSRSNHGYPTPVQEAREREIRIGFTVTTDFDSGDVRRAKDLILDALRARYKRLTGKDEELAAALLAYKG